VVQTVVHCSRVVTAPLPQQPAIEQLPQGVQSGQLQTQHAPCAMGTQARAASVASAATCSATH
jgi:hypothetical protein